MSYFKSDQPAYLLAPILLIVGAILGSSQLASAVPLEPLNDRAPGSFLLFPKFDIRGEDDTQIRITNNGGESINVHVNYVCPGIKHINEFCASLDTTLSLTPHQTRIFNVSGQHPPCNQGYLVAYAYGDGGTIGGSAGLNQPVSYNYLTGSYNISDGKRLESDDAIIDQSPATTGAVLGSQGKLRFGVDYLPISTDLYTDFLSVDPGNEKDSPSGTRLTLLTLDVLAGMQNPPAVAFIDFWNAAEVPYSTSLEFICWTEVQLDHIDLNFLRENLGTDRGSMLIHPAPNCPIPGACPPLEPYDATMLGVNEEYAEGEISLRVLQHDQVSKATAFQPR